MPDTPTPEKNRGAQTGFENTLLRIREAIHSLVETVGQDTHEEREKCLNVWCLHELLEVRGYCIGRLHFLWMMKPKGAGRVSNIDRGLPFLPPPPAPGVRMRWPRRQLIMQPAQKGQIITARVCVCILLFSVRATGRRCEERRCTDTSPEATASKPKNIFINQSAHQHRESADGVFEFMNDDA